MSEEASGLETEQTNAVKIPVISNLSSVAEALKVLCTVLPLDKRLNVAVILVLKSTTSFLWGLLEFKNYHLLLK